MHQSLGMPMLTLIGSCCLTGKSRLTETLKDRPSEADTPCVLVHQDRWLADLEPRRQGSGGKERYHCAAIQRDINSLFQGRPSDPAAYDARMRRRVSEASAEPIQIIRGISFVEGVMGLAFRDLCEMAGPRIHVDIEDSVCWK